MQGWGNFIAGETGNYQHDNLIEEIIGGTVLSVLSPVDEINLVSSKRSPYILADDVFSALTHGTKFSARGCADSGTSANLCPVALCSQYSIKVESTFGWSYNFKDASANQLCVVGESTLFLQLPEETKSWYLRVLGWRISRSGI